MKRSQGDGFSEDLVAYEPMQALLGRDVDLPADQLLCFATEAKESEACLAGSVPENTRSTWYSPAAMAPDDSDDSSDGSEQPAVPNIVEALAPAAPPVVPAALPDLLQAWGITAQELTEIVRANPSMRGLMFGYVAEYKLRKMWFSDEKITSLKKPDDHDRKQKQDLIVQYKGAEITVEVESLQSSMVRAVGEDSFVGKFQCDASDKRLVQLPNGEEVRTTCLLVGQFDLLAACLFEFGQKWRFAFAHNRDLPRSTYRGYTESQRQHLLATMVNVTWPLQPPFAPDPYPLMDEIVASRSAK